MIPLAGYDRCQTINPEEEMIIEKFYDLAAAEYYCNVCEFIGNGEGRELTRLHNLHIRTKYPKVELWYDSLDQAGKL